MKKSLDRLIVFLENIRILLLVLLATLCMIFGVYLQRYFDLKDNNSENKQTYQKYNCDKDFCKLPDDYFYKD